jgi:hypothetical protein
MTTTLIPGLSGTATHQLSILVYRAHRGNGDGICGRCRRRHPCPRRRAAAELIAAAGDDPRRYDQTPPDTCAHPTHPGWDGYQVGGQGRRPLHCAGYQYDRHDG